MKQKTLQRLTKRFHKKYVTEPNTGCWLWTDAPDKDGYGRIQTGKHKTLKAHRVAYLLLKGPLDPKLVIMHSCDNRSCVNPQHLRLGTVAENNLDMIKKGRYICGGKPHPGEKNGMAKLTANDVRDIRFSSLMSEKNKDLAVRYGMHPGTIDKIIRNVLWKTT